MKQVISICFKWMVATSSLLSIRCNSMRTQKGELSLKKRLSPYFVVISDNPEANLLLKENRLTTDIIG